MNSITLDDERELVKLLQKGDARAFRVVYDYYWPLMYSHALRMLQNENDAEDMVQELFLTFYRQLPYLTDGSSLGGWLFVALRNKILNHFRNQKNRMEHFEYWVQQEYKSLRQPMSPLETVQLKELETLLAYEVNQMPERMKNIFEMSRQEYLSHKEIAIQLQISEKTVKTQINNALRILRSKFHSFIFCFF